VPALGRLEAEAQARQGGRHVASLADREARPEWVALVEEQVARRRSCRSDGIDELLELRADAGRAAASHLGHGARGQLQGQSVAAHE
jgi:hypothetical protein